MKTCGLWPLATNEKLKRDERTQVADAMQALPVLYICDIVRGSRSILLSFMGMGWSPSIQSPYVSAEAQEVPLLIEVKKTRLYIQSITRGFLRMLAAIFTNLVHKLYRSLYKCTIASIEVKYAIYTKLGTNVPSLSNAVLVFNLSMCHVNGWRCQPIRVYAGYCCRHIQSLA